jgi:hypothetical protein
MTTRWRWTPLARRSRPYRRPATESHVFPVGAISACPQHRPRPRSESIRRGTPDVIQEDDNAVVTDAIDDDHVSASGLSGVTLDFVREDVNVPAGGGALGRSRMSLPAADRTAHSPLVATLVCRNEGTADVLASISMTPDVVPRMPTRSGARHFTERSRMSLPAANRSPGTSRPWPFRMTSPIPERLRRVHPFDAPASRRRLLISLAPALRSSHPRWSLPAVDRTPTRAMSSRSPLASTTPKQAPRVDPRDWRTSCPRASPRW